MKINKKKKGQVEKHKHNVHTNSYKRSNDDLQMLDRAKL